jgi:hypothetical protein
MRHRSIVFFAIVGTVTLTLGLARPAAAQWYSDSVTNTPVCTATGTQDYPKACSDGSDGVIVTWEDTRGGTGFRVWAQRLDNNGRPVWTANGIALAATGNIAQRYPVIASDGSGGAYIVWQDWRNSASQGIDLYCQHVKSDGSLAYDSGGRQLAGGPNDQMNPVITSDGRGNAFVVWEENNASSTSQPDLGINKLTSTGIAWSGTTTLLTNQASKQRRAAICDDGSGGCYVAWDNSADDPIAIYGQHLDASGSKSWTVPYGLQIYKAPTSSITTDSKNVALRRDGNQLLITWETTNGNSTADGQDVYANRLLSNGTKVYYTAPPVTGNYQGNEQFPQIFSDDSLETGTFPYNGFFTIFQSSFLSPHLGMVRMFADGITQLPKTAGSIVSITSTNYGINGFSAVPCYPGSAIVAWNDSRSDSSVYAQRVDRATAKYFPLGAPSLWGLPISVRVGVKANQVALVPRTNGAIAVWTDLRSGTADIYSQLIFKDGTLPIELSSYSVTSPKSSRPEVDVMWETANELDCAGFEIDRREIGDGKDNTWTFVADYATTNALRGAGSSNAPRHYAYIDRDVQSGTYEYRLVDISLDGEKKSHGTKLVEVGSSDVQAWSFGPNVPNPVQLSTTIPLTLSESALVDITIADASGRIVSHPATQLYSAGEHKIVLSTNDLPAASGMYLVTMTATDPTTGSLLWRSPKPVEMAVMR